MARIRTHPGEMLRGEFMRPLNLSACALEEKLQVQPNRLTKIINCECNVTAEMALRLSQYFGTTPEFWLKLQKAHDLSRAAGEHD